MRSRASAAVLFILSTGLFSLPVSTQTQGVSISTVAGTGNYGFADGAATSAAMDAVYAIACDGGGFIYLADSWNNRIRRIGTDQMITTLAGTGEAGFSGDGGPAREAKLSYPRGIAVDVKGNIYFSDSGNARVRKITPAGMISTIAGTGTAGFSGDGGPATSALLNMPRGLALDESGNLYVADSLNFRIRKVNPQQTISTIAGMGAHGNSGDGGPAASATIGMVQSIAIDSSGNLIFTDVYNHCVRKIATSGTISAISGGGFGSAGDGGSASSAQFRFPHGLAVDSQGRIFVADSGNHRIRMIDSNGIVTTVAGTGSAGFSGDGATAISAQLNYPYAIAADPFGDLLIADLRNYRVRKLDTSYQTAGHRRYFPYFMNQASTLQKLTSLAVVNLSSQRAALRFRAHGADGSVLGEAQNSLEPLAQMALFLHELIPSLADGNGWLEMESDAPGVEGAFMLWNAFTATDGAAVTGTALREFIFPITEEAQIGLANPGSERAVCTLGYTSGAGVTLNSLQMVLAGKGQASITASQLKPAGETGGYYHGTCDANVAAVQTFGHSGWLGVLSPLDPTATAGSAMTMYAPQYAVGGGYASRLHIINLEQAAHPVTLTMIGDDGQVRGRPYVLNLPPRGSATAEGVEPFGLTPRQEGVQGYVKIESASGRFAGAVSFTDESASSFGSALSLVRTGAATAFFPQVAQNKEWWTGMAGVNVNASEAMVTVRVYNTEGQMVGMGSRAIPPGGRVCKVLSEFTALPDMTKGYFIVTSTQPLAFFALFGNTSGDVLVAIPSIGQGFAPVP